MKNEPQNPTGIQYDEMMKLLREVNQRTTRTESRMVQLGDHVGANLRLRMRTDVKRDGKSVWVEVDALDVSISRIVTALQERGIREGQISVALNGRQIMIIDLANIGSQWPARGGGELALSLHAGRLQENRHDA